jgi:hypothetical protein
METCPISSEDLAELIKALEHMEEVDQLEEDCPTPQRIPRIYAARIPLLVLLLRHQAVIESLMQYIELNMDHRFYVICAEIFGVSHLGRYEPLERGCF